MQVIFFQNDFWDLPNLRWEGNHLGLLCEGGSDTGPIFGRITTQG